MSIETDVKVKKGFEGSGEPSVRVELDGTISEGPRSMTQEDVMALMERVEGSTPAKPLQLGQSTRAIGLEY